MYTYIYIYIYKCQTNTKWILSIKNKEKIRKEASERYENLSEKKQKTKTKKASSKISKFFWRRKRNKRQHYRERNYYREQNLSEDQKQRLLEYGRNYFITHKK